MTKAKPYFGRKVGGTNADLERHTKTERELRYHITQLDAVVASGSASEMDFAALDAYHILLNKLMESKAEVVDTLGRQKK